MRGIVVSMSAALVGGTLVLASSSPGAAAPQSVVAQASPSGLPQTAAEHLARADFYRGRAAAYRAEADEHRKMFTDYERRTDIPIHKAKTGRELPWITKMRQHCDSYVREATRLAAEADRFAEFHRMSAAEMGGAAPAAPATTTPAATGRSNELSLPATAEEHAARAAAYQERAAAYRKDAESHRTMFADYQRAQGNPAMEGKTGRELPWVAKMRKHCDAYMKEAEKMAAEADRFAEFHRMLAEAAKGK